MAATAAIENVVRSSYAFGKYLPAYSAFAALRQLNWVVLTRRNISSLEKNWTGLRPDPDGTETFLSLYRRVRPFVQVDRTYTHESFWRTRHISRL